MDLILENVKITDPSQNLDAVPGDIFIKSGVITDGPDMLENPEIIDCKGLTAIPGLVDAHCHLRDPGFEYKEDITSGTRAAAKGGFTSIAPMPNTRPVADNSPVITYIKEKARTAGVVKVYPIGAISKGQEGKELAEMGEMKEAGAVAVSDDGKPVMSASLMKKALLYSAMFEMPVISHCEDVDLADDGYMNEGYTSTVLGLRGITRAAEEVMISREIILSETTGVPVHIAHVSTKLGIELIREAKKRGVKVTCETCPHYFTLTDEACLGFNTYAKVNPPLREQADVNAVIEGLIDGTIDIIATDHAPHHKDEKNVEFALAANGISGFETAFGLSYTCLVKPGYLTLSQLVEKMSVNPAKLLKINAGTLENGMCADITLVDLDKVYIVDVDKFVSKGKNSPYNGFELYGSVEMTVVDGNIKFQEME